MGATRMTRMTSRSRSTIVALVVLLVGLGAAGALWYRRAVAPTDVERGVRVKLALDGAREATRLVRDGDGRYHFVVLGPGGTPSTLTPDELAEQLFAQQRGHGWLSALFNISTPAGIAWVAMGLVGQLVFAGRMIVQWLHSERLGRSEVPPIFWWMSLVGSIMLLAYFGWRVDIVGILGQGLGFVVYLRNLMLLGAAGRSQGAPDDEMAVDPSAGP